MLEVTPAILHQVAKDNLRIHKIGETDGFSPETAEEMGFITNPEDLSALSERAAELMNTKPDTVKKVGGVICGDCSQVIPCAHADITRSGRGFTRG